LLIAFVAEALLLSGQDSKHISGSGLLMRFIVGLSVDQAPAISTSAMYPQVSMVVRPDPAVVSTWLLSTGRSEGCN